MTWATLEKGEYTPFAVMEVDDTSVASGDSPKSVEQKLHVWPADVTGEILLVEL